MQATAESKGPGILNVYERAQVISVSVFCRTRSKMESIASPSHIPTWSKRSKPSARPHPRHAPSTVVLIPHPSATPSRFTILTTITVILGFNQSCTTQSHQALAYRPGPPKNTKKRCRNLPMRAPDRSLASVNKATSVLLCANTPRAHNGVPVGKLVKGTGTFLSSPSLMLYYGSPLSLRFQLEHRIPPYCFAVTSPVAPSSSFNTSSWYPVTVKKY
jgi:hypothetical protein